jgi:hypothetical protein
MRLRTAALIALLPALVQVAGCGEAARDAFDECTIGISQAVTLAQDEQERRKQEIVYASSCMFERGYVLDAERQRTDATKRRLREPYSYWRRR